MRLTVSAVSLIASVRRPRNFQDVAVLYQVLADLVVIVHAAFVAFAILGGLLALRWRWLPWLHVPAVSWGAVIEFTGRICPLTPLESSLRNAGGSAGYSGDFIQHYVFPLLYPTTFTRNDQIALGVGLLLVNVAVYGVVLHGFRRRPVSRNKPVRLTRAAEPIGKRERWRCGPRG